MKLSIALGSCALLLSSAALADAPGGTTQQGSSGSAPHQGTAGTSQQSASGTTTPAPASAPVQTMRPGATTTLTSGEPDSAITPAPVMTRPVEHDTVTVYQSVRPNKPLLYFGGGLFLGSYATTAVLTAVNTDNGGGDKTMYLPVVGPWLHLADAKESTTDTLLVAGSGVLQGVGVGLMAASLFVPEKVKAATIEAGDVKIVPTATSTGKGSTIVGAYGTF